MTGTYLLLLIALTSAASLVPALRNKAYDWVLVNAGFLVAAAAGYLVAPERAGAWLVAPYVVFAIAPLVAVAQLNRMLAARKNGAARVLARIAYVLHPSRGHRRLIRLNDAFLLASDGKVEEAATILREAGHGQDMDLEMLRLENRWTDIIAYIEAATDKPLEHGAAVLYVRALGETGQLDRLIEAYFDLTERWAKRDDMSDEVASVRLFVAAFLGQPALVEEMCAGPLRHFNPSIKQYWVALAHAAGGDRARATAMFEELQHDDEARIRAAARFHLEQPPVRVEQLGDNLRALVDDLARAIRDVATYAPPPAQRPWLSYGIVGALVIVHSILAWQQRSDPMAFYTFGVFWSPAVLDDGEWWRLVAAMFLHASWLHLAMNVLGLLWFGPFVERFIGRVRFGLIYVAGGIGGFAVLAAIVALGWRDTTLALGASGAVMALIGASTGIFLRASARSPVAAKRLRDMLTFVGIQVVFDILAPRVSMTAHVAGLVIGFGFGLLMKPRAVR
ncbi:MAG TPA: rhomboid family intramembrane serine protease [Kofleriaceae bacterium]